MTGTTKIFLNTWGAYNNGSIGYGWMTPEQARTFIEENPERHGGEFFIADIDNYTGVHFSNLDYADVYEVIETIEALEELEESDRENVVALMEYLGTDNAQEAIDRLDDFTFYADIDQYYDFCDELVEMEMDMNSILARYFDYEAYHRDCSFDVSEMSNGIVIAA